MTRSASPLALWLADRLADRLAAFEWPDSVGQGAAPALAVAYSGGRDSTALLHAAWRLAGQRGFALHALHIHHGLSPRADAWAAQGRAQCARWSRRGAAIHFHVRRLELVCAPGESVEARAREGRYAALAAMARAQGCAAVLLAHHANDQAETFLLQALRGGGVAGLAAMPALQRRDGVVWLRPWLDRPRAEIEAYVRRHRLAYVDDDSNAQPRFARNRLRLAVWPALEAAFPQALTVLGAAARHAQDARECLEALAEQDVSRARDGDGGLQLAALADLSAARRRNLLRHWLRAAGQPASAALLERLAEELPLQPDAQVSGARPPSWPLPTGWTIRAWRGRLGLHSDTVEAARCEPLWLRIEGPGSYELHGWSGRLQVEWVDAAGEGLALARLQRVQVRPRTGGESFQRAAGSLPRALKKQFQAAGVAAWQRQGPLLYDASGVLLFVPGLGLDARCVTGPDAAGPRVVLRWLAALEGARASGGDGTVGASESGT